MANGFEIIPVTPGDDEDEAYEAEVATLMNDPVVQLMATMWESQRPAGADYSPVGTGGPHGYMDENFRTITCHTYARLAAGLGHKPLKLRFDGALPDAVARLASGTIPAARSASEPQPSSDDIDAILAALGGQP